MNNKKIKTLIALAITTSIIAGADLNTTIASAHTTDTAIGTENTSKGYGIGDSVYDELLKKGWTPDATGALTVANNAFKFRNLKGENGKDASVIINCDFPDNNDYILDLLNLMINKEKGSSLTALELGRLIGNGTSTIKDGSRFINVQYDGKIDYTITITFYNYGYTPSYIMPSFDNYETISTLEDLINKNVLSISELYNSSKWNIPIIWGGSKNNPIKLLVNSSDTSDINSLIAKLNDVFENLNSMQTIEEHSDKVIIELKVNLENAFYNGICRDFIYFNFEIDKSNTIAINSINDFMTNFESKEDNEDNTNTGNADSTVNPPSTDGENQDGTTTTPSEDGATNDDGSVDNDTSSEDTKPELPPVVDNDANTEDNGSTVTPPSADSENQEETTTTPSEDGATNDDGSVDNDTSSEDTKPELPPVVDNDANTEDNGSTVTPPSTDGENQDGTTTTPSEDGATNDDGSVDNDTSSEDTKPELPPVVDNDANTEDNGSTVTPPSADSENQEGTTTNPSDDGATNNDETVDSDDSYDDTKIDIPYIGEITNVMNNAITDGTISLDNSGTQSNSIIKIDINNVELSKVQTLFDSFATVAKDVKITSNDEYTTITFKVKKESNPLLRESDEYFDIVLTIKNEYTDVVNIANNFVKELVSSDSSTPIENDNTDINESELNTNNTVESDTTTNVTTSNTVAQTTTSTTTLNKVKELPKTGNVSSLPLIGTLTLSLGILLRRNKK